MSVGWNSDRDDTGAHDGIGPRSWHERPVLAGISVLLTLFVLPGLIWWFSRDTESGQDPTVEEPQLTDNIAALGEAFEEARQAATAHVEELFTPESPEQVRFMNEVKRVQAVWGELDGEAKAWHDRYSRVLKGKEGRKLAGQSSLVKRFAEVDELGRPSPEDVERLKERLAGFATIAEKMSEPFTVHEEPTEEVFDELRALGKEVSDALGDVREVDEQLDRLERQASDLPLAEVPLETALAKFRQQEMTRRADELVANRRDEIDKQHQELVALEIKDAGRKMGDALKEARDETAQLEREKRRLEEAAKEAARKREKARIEAELERQFALEYPQMERYVTVFTSDGYTQLVGGTFLPIAVKGPVSYRSLVDAGLLNMGEESLLAFWNTIDKSKNDRNLGAFPAPGFSGEHRRRHYETVLKVQQFLRQFGPLMVKRGYLAP